MLRVKTHVESIEGGVPALRPAYIYRWGPDLVVGSLYCNALYSGLRIYECVRLLHTTPTLSSTCTGSEYLMLPLNEDEILDRLTKGVPNIQEVFRSTLPVRSVGIRISTPTLTDDYRDLDAALNELRG